MSTTTGKTWKIVRVDVLPVRLPLIEPFIIAYGVFPDVLSVLVRIETAGGVVGWGEATPDPFVTGETWESTAVVLRHTLAPSLLGRDLRDRDAALEHLDALIAGVPAAKAAIDIALFDTLGRATDLPLWALLGGRSKEYLRISRVVSMDTPEIMAKSARRHIDDGFTTIKLKLGGEADIALDARRTAAVRDAVGEEVAIKIDVNQGWHTPGTAIAAIRRLLTSRPLYIEQPVDAWNLEGLAEVRRQTGVTIMVDEGCHDARDLQRIVQLAAADLVNIKLMKTGGLAGALHLNAIAATAGITAQVGSMVESAIGSAAGLHLALALSNVATVEMGGPLMLSADIDTNRDFSTWYQSDRIVVPDHPGLGFTINETAVTKHATDRWTLTD